MYLKRALLFTLLYILFCVFFHARTGKAAKSEPRPTIEQLSARLENTPESTERVDILLKLTGETWSRDPDKAREYARQALDLSKKLDYPHGISDAYNKIGVTYQIQGDYPRALEFQLKSLKVARESQDKKVLLSTYNNIGIIYNSQGNSPLALEYFLKCLKTAEDLENQPAIAVSLNNIGSVYQVRGDLDKALEYCRKSLEIKEKLGDTRRISNTYNNIGAIYKSQGKYSQALEYLFKGLAISEQAGDKQRIAAQYINIGNVHKARGDDVRALEFYNKSEAIARQIKARPQLALALRAIGSSYIDRKEYSKSIGYLTRSLDIARDIRETDSIKAAAMRLSEAYAALGQYKKAYRHHVLFKEQSDSLLNKANVEKITRLEMQYQFDKTQKQLEMEQQKKELQKEAKIKLHRLLAIIFAAVAVLLALVFYTRYRLKVKVNRRLTKEIHDRKKAEAELVKSAKLETVGILSGGIAHDFNNLLTIILGNLQMAKFSLEDSNPNPGHFIDAAEQSSQQAVELVKKFLTISAGGWLERSKISMDEVIRDTMNSFSQLTDTPVTVSLDPGLKPFDGDGRQLRQVLVNLLTNAYEATSASGDQRKIEISARPVTLHGENDLSLAIGEYIRLSVSDNGEGIPEDVLNKIFDPYFSTKARGAQKGMGMGLAVCRSIVLRHGGHIAVTSNPGQGTTFDVYLLVKGEG